MMSLGGFQLVLSGVRTAKPLILQLGTIGLHLGDTV
jgi:hypothetical protein